MYTNSAHIPYSDSIKYIGYTFESCHKDGNDISWSVENVICTFK